MIDKHRKTRKTKVFAGSIAVNSLLAVKPRMGDKHRKTRKTHVFSRYRVVLLHTISTFFNK